MGVIFSYHREESDGQEHGARNDNWVIGLSGTLLKLSQGIPGPSLEYALNLTSQPSGLLSFLHPGPCYSLHVILHFLLYLLLH